ncbi:MAG: C2H2-type zinc finger protein [Kistimonas sp.]|nr:C2H2-type zinc finger protein [Kistimonas sp.]
MLSPTSSHSLTSVPPALPEKVGFDGDTSAGTPQPTAPAQHSLPAGRYKPARQSRHPARASTTDYRSACPVADCPQGFNCPKERRRHMYTHDEKRPHVCPVENCTKRFARPSGLAVHHRSHTGERPFTCPVPTCGKAFTTSGQQKVHLYVHTRSTAERLPPEIYDLLLSQASGWQQRKPPGSRHRVYSCLFEGCSASFRRPAEASRHSHTHSQERPFSCPVPGCSTAYKIGYHLDRHLKTHALVQRQLVAAASAPGDRPGSQARRQPLQASDDQHASADRSGLTTTAEPDQYRYVTLNTASVTDQLHPGSAESVWLAPTMDSGPSSPGSSVSDTCPGNLPMTDPAQENAPAEPGPTPDADQVPVAPASDRLPPTAEKEPPIIASSGGQQSRPGTAGSTAAADACGSHPGQDPESLTQPPQQAVGGCSLSLSLEWHPSCTEIQLQLSLRRRD